MGLTSTSTGISTIDTGLLIKKETSNDKVIALAGNPNVGKSTIFNTLTGLKQHTGNWSGKTVTNAQGTYNYNGVNYIIVDIPGTYSLMAHSEEEVVARDFICFGESDISIIVCDAICLERNLNLVLQTIEITDNVVVCINLMDEAKKKGIQIDFKQLQKNLGVPVVGTSARSGNGIKELMSIVSNLNEYKQNSTKVKIEYDKIIEEAINILEPTIRTKLKKNINTKWISLKLIEYDETLINSLNNYLGFNIMEDELILQKILEARNYLEHNNISKTKLHDMIVTSILTKAENICKNSVFFEKSNYNLTDRKIDKILTNKWTGIPIMLLLLSLILWLTIVGANYPSQIISNGLFWFEDKLTSFFIFINAPSWIHGILVLGVYRVVAWVVAVMLPPMAIFFPLFTLLEDLGYLPRVAFNLDKYFKKCCACGKQALTMCMGFGCNAAGVIGCRIIDSKRERLIAIITNNFVPCNGRFPTLIAIITMFFVGSTTGIFQTLTATLILTSVIVFGIAMTFLISKILSKTILKGLPSSFTLELPPFRKPQVGKVIVHSIFDRTLFVLGRAVLVSAPTGLIIWIMANLTIGDLTILSYCTRFLDPFAKLLGLDGVILMAFILGFPANEIVIPIIIMTYMSTGSILEFDNLIQLKELLINNGWTFCTAICTMLFSLMHWPCSTTCLTIKKETQSFKWTAISFIIPTVLGATICFIFTLIVRFFNLI